jgi:collagen triple helix repeat protein
LSDDAVASSVRANFPELISASKEGKMSRLTGALCLAALDETNQIVSYLGSSWIALRRNTAQPPDGGTDWNLLAQKGETGATGERGERGETGAEGPQGIQGPPGETGAPGISPAFPASTIFAVPATGRLTIQDPNVTADSVVIAAYVGGSLLPPAVTHIVDGQITILALPGKRLRYVVFR